MLDFKRGANSYMSAAINKAIIFSTRTSPSETVSSGEAYFWLEGQTIKYKDDTQTVHSLATGVSPEEVQDIVGAFVSAGSNKLSVTYNDASNTLVIDVVPANIAHSGLSGVGTNTHTQIDSHLASTSNPHSTTASQVGADPIGSASAAQAFAIQRANHTGTQAATTIVEDSTHRFATDTEKTTWNAKEPSITATTSADYYRGDKTFQTLNKTAVGLGNVDNTSDTNKPVSTLQQTAINARLEKTQNLADLSNVATARTNLGLGSAALNNTGDFDAAGAAATAQAFAIQRANHTGTQLSSTISDFIAAVRALLTPTSLNSTTTVSTTSGTYSTITTMTTSLAAGTYKIEFSCGAGSTTDGNGDIALHIGGTEELKTRRTLYGTASGATSVEVRSTLSFSTTITLASTQTVDVRYRRNVAGTFSIYSREMLITQL